MLSVQWHWELLRLQRSGEPHSVWGWRAVESLRLLNLALGVVAVVLLFLTFGKGSWIASLLAFAMAVLCHWTFALVT